ncbi:MAG: ABC transporter permease [Acidiferrobacterales bacterium]
MPFRPVFFWTDVLIYLLLLAVAAFAFYAARHEHLRAPWRQVKRRALAMGALVVLVAYVTVGLLDTVHLQWRLPGTASEPVRYSPRVESLLDVLCRGLRSRAEKSYSAPFATHGYTKEMVESADGRIRFAYARLRHGGAHLEDPSARGANIALRTAVGAGTGVLIWAVLVAALVHGAVRRRSEAWSAALARLVRGDTMVPWRTMLATAACVIMLAAVTVALAPYYHVLGTDQVGQDVLYNSLKSIRTGLVIGTLTTLVMLPFAVVFGVMAGYFGGWVDDIIQYTYTTLSSIPSVLLIAAAILSLQVYIATHEEAFATVAERADLRLLFLCLILGVTSWTGLCRLLRGETLKLREVDYIEAALALGVSDARIMARHVVPNVMHLVLITVVLDFSGLVLAEAVLSYVGVGVDPSMNSWGNMINGARLEMAREPIVWWSLASAFVFMFGLVLAANLFADAVRDAFDPRLRK